MDVYKDKELDSEDVQRRILTVNSAASHTTSYVRPLLIIPRVVTENVQTFIQALQNMAMYPECRHACIAEAEEAIGLYGWTRECIDSLALLDSFFKESMRLNGLGSSTFSS